MKEILFVDDEPHVLDSLRNLLRKQRKEWNMSFAEGGEAALQHLRAAPCDVIVSDMRMPVIDGAALLSKVLVEYPHVVRIVLSGQTEQEVSRRMVHVAHQFLAKPCDGRTVQQTIQRACELQTLLEHPALRRTVGEIGQLPIKPAIYTKLVEVLAEPNSSIGDAARVLESDMGITSKILQVVNSAFFGMPQRVTDITAAVAYLGLEMVKTLTLSVEMRQSQEIKGQAEDVAGFSIDAIQEHGLMAARIARRLLPDKLLAQDAFAAALLKDAGLIVLISRLPEVFKQIIDEARASGRSILEVEQEILGITHQEIGAYLLGIWGLPYNIVEAVAHHHSPGRAASQTWDALGAAHVASAFVSERFEGKAAPSIGTTIDLPYLDHMGVAKQLPGWRAMAAGAAGSSRG
jgi:HD-like signal output (HDOD) protein/CheY-like chemotaxis protein